MHLDPGLQSLVDQEHADIASILDGFPTYQVFFTTAYGCRESARLVAVDSLARLSEIADKSPEEQLLVIVARLHAWAETTAQ